ncbi:hypothetical protein WA026_023040 [Henosepilachna vigintioctopunctata]|uniref:Uncharacterized protein n=1 Tax=Henosepilachna vigintioctopunctata TaxID=420089 RepID=A0AAW1VIS5_9CUCU
MFICLTFVCHSFVCDSKSHARQLTLALSVVFEDYAKRMRDSDKTIKTNKFTIDIRSPEQQAAEADGVEEETDA